MKMNFLLYHLEMHSRVRERKLSVGFQIHVLLTLPWDQCFSMVLKYVTLDGCKIRGNEMKEHLLHDVTIGSWMDVIKVFLCKRTFCSSMTLPCSQSWTSIDFHDLNSQSLSLQGNTMYLFYMDFWYLAVAVGERERILALDLRILKTVLNNILGIKSMSKFSIVT